MAGRGRGRGRNLSFNIEHLGFGQGEALPQAVHQPPPLFPPLMFRPVPQKIDEDQQYMLDLKQEIRSTFQKSVFYWKPQEKKRDIERYSDKYQLGVGQQDGNEVFKPDFSRLPSELQIVKRKVKRLKSNPRPKLSAKGKEDVQKTLERLKQTLDDTDGQVVQKEDKEEEEEEDGDEDEAEVEEEEVYEEELEEETDYGLSYFDNGEGYGEDDDDIDEGPIY